MSGATALLLAGAAPKRCSAWLRLQPAACASLASARDAPSPALSCWSPRLVAKEGSSALQRHYSALGNGNGLPPKFKSLYLSHVSAGGSITPLTLGLVNHFERHIPTVGFFMPISTPPLPGAPDDVGHHVDLVHEVFRMAGSPKAMVGVSDAEAARLISARKQSDLLDRIYSAYVAYKEGHDFVMLQGRSSEFGGAELDAQIAQALNSPVLMAVSGNPSMTLNDYFNQAMMKRQVFVDHKVDVVGVVFNQVPLAQQNTLAGQLRTKLEKEGLTFAGAIPTDPILGSQRLDAVRAALGAKMLYGRSATLDKEFSDVIVASQRVEELLEMLDDRPSDAPPPLVITSQDRTDIVLALLSAQISISGPTVSGVLLAKAGRNMESRRYAKDAVTRIFAGVEEGSSYKGAQLPVLSCDEPITEVINQIRNLGGRPSLLPTSTRKIVQSKILFDKYVNVDAIDASVPTSSSGTIMTPKMFTHNLKAFCLKNPQRIVLPESADPRILAAAAEVSARGLAKITLLGNPDKVLAEAKKLDLDLSGVAIHDITTSDRLDKYVDALVEARKKKALPRETAYDMVKGDMNMFGVMMVACGDADGMVSGAMHTTAATIRPAMQVLRAGDKTIVSSVFFMCLPDKVLVYGDCAVNPTPSADELAQIAVSSHDTARAFGLEPRVAMLSYSTLGSGAGPDVQKVTEAAKLVRSKRPDIKIEGPIQYDAAIDPKVAAVKIKTPSEVAGKATVFVFPDLNTGNNTYKAVQQASGAIAMGPVMQGLNKPVNDLSRGCTVPDVVNTICVTSIQAMQARGVAPSP